MRKVRYKREEGTREVVPRRMPGGREGRWLTRGVHRGAVLLLGGYSQLAFEEVSTLSSRPTPLGLYRLPLFP